MGPAGPIGATGATGPMGSTGATGPQGPQGPPGSGSGGFHGIQEFTVSGTITVPDGVTGILVELWGAGGGGDCHRSPAIGGGGGGYTRAVVSVTPGNTYNVKVGNPGISGFTSYGVCNPLGDAGTDGGATQITDSSANVLASAGGGGGGQLATYVSGFGYACGGGSGGAGGSGVSTVGRNGTSGGCATPANPASVAYGGVAPLGSIQPPAGVGAGATSGDPVPVYPGVYEGGPGYALVVW
jgi:hypothetical protein